MTFPVWAVAAAGLTVGWLLRALGAARFRAAAARAAAESQEALAMELNLARRDLALVEADRAGLRDDLASSARTVGALRVESEAHVRVLHEAQRERDRSAARAEAALADRRVLAERVSELEARVAEFDELARNLRVQSEQRAGLAARLERMTVERHRLESERTRAVLMAETLERQLKQLAESTRASGSLLAAELAELKRRLEAGAELLDRTRRAAAAAESERDALAQRTAQLEADRRAAALSHQEALAALEARLGGIHALAERVEPLRRQLEDREGLIRSVAEERDEATRAAIRQERTSIAQVAELERELARLRAAATDAAAAARRTAEAESRLAVAVRERDDYAAAAARARMEIETLHAEINDRDLRFRALLEDRRHFVEQSQDQIARLREDMTRSRLAGGDDLKRITGIGPHLERRLKQHGITTFRQIAQWSESDIERISKELGPFAHRIHRDRWVEQAQRACEFEGEPAA